MCYIGMAYESERSVYMCELMHEWQDIHFRIRSNDSIQITAPFKHTGAERVENFHACDEE